MVSMQGVDVALLQEAGAVPKEVANRVTPGSDEHWDSHVWNSRWWDKQRFAYLTERWPKVVKLSDRIDVEWFRQVSPISYVEEDEIAVSGIGTIAAARITPVASDTKPFIAVSMYARWMSPHPSTRSKWSVGHSDGSAHRIISDLSGFIGDVDPASHRIIAAGDLNMVYGGMPIEPQSLADRDRTVFDRFTALGLELVGPQYPAGRRASPTPVGLPADTRNVPTFCSNRQTPETAQSQLDYVFASRGFHEQIKVRALNSPEEWGASDHCRIVIDVG